MPGPHQVQHHPLQTNPSGSPEQDARDTNLTPQPASDGLRGRREPRSTLNTAQLSPSQQAFVDRLQRQLGREQAAERQLAGGSGEAGDTASSPEQWGSERSTGGEEQPSDHVPYAESQQLAEQAEEGEGEAPASKPPQPSPIGQIRATLRSETERQAERATDEGQSRGQSPSFRRASQEQAWAAEERAEMQQCSTAWTFRPDS